MNVLVVGSGGREHALVHALTKSQNLKTLFALPGSPGMKDQAQCLSGDPLDFDSVLKVVRDNDVSLVVVGPEVPLVNGLSDFLREHGVLVFGPSQKAAQLEGSKIFSKEFMVRAGVPTASYSVVHSVSSTLSEAKKFTPPYVLKADGLAAGKGVFICSDLDELKDRATALFDKKILGEGNSQQALLEQFHRGTELSAFALTNGQEFELLPFAQDYKRIFDGDNGPNTGGMGTVAPLELSASSRKQILTSVLEPTVRALSSESLDYRGVLFVGIMMTSQGPQVLEYNVRFGDPETQVLLPLLQGDWLEVFSDVAQGRMPTMNWNQKKTSCVVVASPGYPESSTQGLEIKGLVEQMHASKGDCYFLHAGTSLSDSGQWITWGGRVLNAVAEASSLEEALKKSYGLIDKISFEGMQFRKDIGSKSNQVH